MSIITIEKAEAKLVIAQLIELSYSTDKELTAKIMAEKGGIKLTVDGNGRARLSGKAGFITFSGKPALDKLGISLKSVSITFSEAYGFKVKYYATFRALGVSLSVAGQFDMKALITSCSGLLCIAARLLTADSNSTHNRQLQEVMGK